MNSTEQNKHTTALSQLEAATAEAIEGLVDAITAERREREQGDLDVAAGARASVGDERTYRLTQANQQMAYIDVHMRVLSVRLEEEITDHLLFVRRRFWSRLNWLITGR